MMLYAAAFSFAPSRSISGSRQDVETSINTVRAGLGYKF